MLAIAAQLFFPRSVYNPVLVYSFCWGLSLELEFVPYQLSHCRYKSDKTSWEKLCFKIGWWDSLVIGRKRPSSARLCRGQDQAHVHRGGSSQHHHRYVLAEDKSRIPDTCTLYTYTVFCVLCTANCVHFNVYCTRMWTFQISQWFALVIQVDSSLKLPEFGDPFPSVPLWTDTRFLTFWRKMKVFRVEGGVRISATGCECGFLQVDVVIY